MNTPSASREMGWPISRWDGSEGIGWDVMGALGAILNGKWGMVLAVKAQYCSGGCNGERLGIKLPPKKTSPKKTLSMFKSGLKKMRQELPCLDGWSHILSSMILWSALGEA